MTSRLSPFLAAIEIAARAAAVALAASASASAWAQTPPKMAPGLWEHSMTIGGGGATDARMAEAQQQLARLPPEQRKMIEQTMAQHGVSTNGHTTTVKVCVTAEQAARGEMPQESRCSQQSSPTSASSMHFQFSCSGDPPSRGEGDFSLQGDKAYTGRNTVDTAIDGKPEHVEMQLAGKWLGADCGSVKPHG